MANAKTQITSTIRQQLINKVATHIGLSGNTNTSDLRIQEIIEWKCSEDRVFHHYYFNLDDKRAMLLIKQIRKAAKNHPVFGIARREQQKVG